MSNYPDGFSMEEYDRFHSQPDLEDWQQDFWVIREAIEILSYYYCR